MSRPVLLDTFSGAGGCAVGCHRAGFDVVGVDIEPQPRFPFEFHQGDALDFIRKHGREFDAIHASPPCQKFTALSVMWNAKEHPDLLAPTRDALKSTERPYVIENVPGAPLVQPYTLCGTMFGLGTRSRELRRHRLFEIHPRILLLLPPCRHGKAVIGVYGDHVRDQRHYRKGANSPGEDKARLAGEAVGIDWMTFKEASQAVPPAYTELVGEHLIPALGLITTSHIEEVSMTT